MQRKVSDSEARVVLIVEDSAAPEAVVPVAGNEELMAMSEFIRNLDVSFEIVSPWYDFLLEVKRSTAERQQNRLLFFDYRYASHNRFRK
jgi:hypothetical protein